MLKIKDDVDLQELEKFGFEMDRELTDDEVIFSRKEHYQKICISKNDRKIFLYEDFNSNCFLLHCNVLYDLIKADLVEKVGD